MASRCGGLRIPLERLRLDKTLSSLESLMRRLSALRDERTNLLLISGGWKLGGPFLHRVTPAPYALECTATTQRLFDMDFTLRYRDLLQEASRWNVSFTTFDPRRLGAYDCDLGQHPGSAGPPPITTRPRPDLDPIVQLGCPTMDDVAQRLDTLRTLSENTDGTAILNTNDLATPLRKLEEDLSAYYLLGYYSSNTKLDGKFRKIEVAVRRPDVRVSARRGYLAPTEEMVRASRTAPSGASPVDDALSLLDLIRADRPVASYASAAPGRLTVVAELPEDAVMTDWARGADLAVTVAAADGTVVGTGHGHVDAGARGAMADVGLAPGAAGPWLVKTTVSATSVRAIGDQFTVKAPAAGLLVGDPILFRAAPGPRSPIRPAADFAFWRSERLHLEWPVLASLDRRTARVLDRQGQPLALDLPVTEQTRLSGTVLVGDLNLAALGGDYVIELTAGSGTQEVRTLVAIRVRR